MNSPSLKPLLLLIEDDPQLQRFLTHLLDSEHFRLIQAYSGEEGIQKVAMFNPDLLLLDLGLPDIDGLTVISRIREWNPIPIIVLSARGQEDDKVKALDLGVDDYLTKPFGGRELLARIRVALRHLAQRQNPQASTDFLHKDLHIDYLHRRVLIRNEEIKLSPTEYKLLCLLTKHAGRVLTHRQILQDVWGLPYSQQAQYVRVYMAQLRRKIEKIPAKPEYIFTEAGIGYRFSSDEGE